MNIKAIFNLLEERIRLRYKYLIIFIFICMFFGIVTKNITYTFGENGERSKLYLESNKIQQKLQIGYENIKEFKFKIGNDSDSYASYKISIKDGDNNTVLTQNVSSVDIGANSERDIEMKLLHGINCDELYFQVEPNSNYNDSNVYLYVQDSNENDLTIDGENYNSKEIVITKGYENVFSAKYVTMFLIIFVLGVFNILFFNPDKIHNFVFSVAMSLGLIVTIINPILDTPDDHAHICRSELTSRGILMISGDNDKYNISKGVSNLINNGFKLIENSNIQDGRTDFEYTESYGNYAGSNIFLGYIPQAIGIILAKILGRIFGGTSIFILLLGRLFNLVSYCAIVRYAIKKTPIFKVPLSVISIAPMSLFIAASFNPDASTYAMVLLCISYSLYIYKKENINVKDMVVFAIISVCVGILKAPYSLIGALILFFRKEKFESAKNYYLRYAVVTVVACICGAWVLFTLINPGDSSAFGNYYVANNVNTGRQISYILSHTKFFVIDFLKDALNQIPTYFSQLNKYGWLTYGPNDGISALYPIFIGSMILLFPNEEVICKRIKSGAILIGSGIYLATCLILYLTWTPVGSSVIAGVQGRYFIPLFSILVLISNGKCNDNFIRRKLEKQFLFVALFFSIIFVITILANYY